MSTVPASARRATYDAIALALAFLAVDTVVIFSVIAGWIDLSLGIVAVLALAAVVLLLYRDDVAEAGVPDLLVNNAGISAGEPSAWKIDADEWWHVFEVNVLGVYLCCRAVIPSMLERGSGRIVNVASGAAYLPDTKSTAYSASKAAVHRFSEILADQLRPHGIPVFSISPGMVRTEMTKMAPHDAPWTPPELAPRLVRALASGRLDRLAGRYLHAEHDDVDDLAARIDEILAEDLNAIRLRR